MSNVIAFRRPTKKPTRQSANFGEALDVLAAHHMTLSSTVLLEGIDDIDAAITRAVKMLRDMPEGRARDLASAELDHIRTQLSATRRLGDNGPRDFDPAA
jgi:hypothetical protein